MSEQVMDNVVKNGSFEEGWTDLPVPGGRRVNQQPNGWNLYWLLKGDTLWGSESDKASGIPEVVHKYYEQLPPEQWAGGDDPLIRHGLYVLKIFSASEAFGVCLTQTITGLDPGTYFDVNIPIRLDVHGSEDPWAAEVGVRSTGNERKWYNVDYIGDKRWWGLDSVGIVSKEGTASVEIFFKSKWNSAVDFFIDDVTVLAVDKEKPPAEVILHIPMNERISGLVLHLLETLNIFVPNDVTSISLELPKVLVESRKTIAAWSEAIGEV